MIDQLRFNLKETAKILGCSDDTVKAYINDGTLRTLPNFKLPYISRKEIERVLSFNNEIKTLREIELEDNVKKLTRENAELRDKLMKINSISS